MGARMDAEGGNLPLPSDTHSEPVSVPSQYDKPHIPEKCRVGLAVANADKPLAKLNGDTSSILERLRNSERAVDIARELGISHVALYAWLIHNSPDEWKAISAGKALARIEQAEHDMDAAEDQVGISKARESHRMGAWSLERVARNIYGEIKPDAGGVTVQVLIARDGDETSARLVAEQ